MIGANNEQSGFSPAWFLVVFPVHRLAPSLSRFLLSSDDEIPERPLFRRVAEADGETARETCITLHLINIHRHGNNIQYDVVESERDLSIQCRDNMRGDGL